MQKVTGKQQKKLIGSMNHADKLKRKIYRDKGFLFRDTEKNYGFGC